MAYTYEDFLNAAGKSGQLSQFDDNDLSLAQSHPEYGLSMLSLKNDYGNAKTDEQRLLINATADQLRNSYAPTSTGGTQSSAVPYNAGSNVAGVPQLQGGFSWDRENDPVWQSYRKQYLREGDRATAQALGQASAASAGRPSTYAAQAATQAGDYYAGQLADKIPTLYQDAYNRYNTDQQLAAGNMQGAYENLMAQIVGYGYQPTEEELLQAGMTPELAQQLYQGWITQNPDAAYYQGVITPQDYRKITGKWPKGYGGGGRGKNNTFWKDYATLRNSRDVSEEAVNQWIEAQMAAGNVGFEDGIGLLNGHRNGGNAAYDPERMGLHDADYVE